MCTKFHIIIELIMNIEKDLKDKKVSKFPLHMKKKYSEV